MIANTLSPTNSPLLAHLDEQGLEEWARVAHERHYAAGQVAIWEGELNSPACLVREGVVRLRQSGENGRDSVLYVARAGDCINLAAALDRQAAPATVEALTSVHLQTVAGADLARLMAQYPALALAVGEQLAADVRHLSTLVKDLALHTVRARLARFLLQHAESAPAHQHWTQERIAEQIGTVRDVVGRALRSLAAEGLIERRRGRLVVLDRRGLEQIAQGE